VLGLLAGLGLLLLVARIAAYVPLFEGWAPVSIDRASPDSARTRAPRRVVLISIDGLAPRVLDQATTPTLDRLAREGARAVHAETVVPSITLTSHASMLSGVGPERHGIRFNRYQPWSDLSLHTIYTECARAGLRCGLFAGKTKFAHFAENESGVERYAYARGAGNVLGAAVDFAQKRDPDFVGIHLAEVDAAGHGVGWDTPAQHRVVERIDALLGRFLAELASTGERPLSVIVTSDHGGHGTIHGTALPEDVRIPWIAWGDGVPAGLEPAQMSTLDTAPTILRLLGRATPPDWEGRAVAGIVAGASGG